jgi:DNA-binding transcriptional regulator YhcF (GntR family)
MDFIDKQPIYMQIADYFCENILTGKWKENEKIPSVREIAVLMEVNPNTAIRAYTFLQDKDIIYNKRGIGYFVAENGYARVLEMKKAEFTNKELPGIFKTMNLLNFKLDDLIRIYKKHIS